MDDDKLVWRSLAKASVLEPHGKALIRHDKLEIAVFRDGDTLHAIDDRCPHSHGASLCTGRIVDGHVKCPAHGLRFRLTDGLLAGSAPGSQAGSLGVRTYPVRIAGDELQISLQANQTEQLR